MPQLRVSIAAEFITGWIGRNVRADPDLEEAGLALGDLIAQCFDAAQFYGISVVEIEAATGREVTDLIQAAFLARWNPEAGENGSRRAS
jgi:hypothetical protein